MLETQRFLYRAEKGNMMKQDKFLIGIIVGILVLVVLAVVFFFVRQSSQGYVTGNEPQDIVHNYAYALQEKDYERAYGYLAEGEDKPSWSEFQAALSPDWVHSSGMGVRILEQHIVEKADDEDEAVVDVVILQGGGGPFDGGYRSNDSARLLKQNGEWKLIAMPYPYWEWGWYTPKDNNN
jgi:hypothetical protein